jgi:two-component system NarL family sensor kinase
MVVGGDHADHPRRSSHARSIPPRPARCVALTAEERERRQLAQDLHDGAIQNLLAARHDLDLPAKRAPEGPEARAHATITATVSELRGAVADLHPYLLEQAGLAAAIGQAARAAAGRAGFALELDLAEGEPGPNDRAVLRCTSELLANVARHARAAHVSVLLQHDETADRVRVRDDGVGFDPVVATSTVRAGHIGLASLRERAEALGGAFSLESAPGAGTVATVTIPRGRS